MASKKKSNKKNTTSRTTKKAVKAVSKSKGLIVLVVIIAILAGLFLAEEYFIGWLGIFDKDDGHTDPPPYLAGDLAIHFLELGNEYTGDSTLIDIGDVEILIDAGSKRNSADTITDYISKYCDDGILEYVIATHAHEDHIAAFVGNNGANKGVFDKFKCEKIIDFGEQTNSTSGIYSDYVTKRTAEIAAGAEYYTALECWNESKEGAQKAYQITEDITLNILYQKFYEESTSNENNYSVCVLITQGTRNYLFTGDLEKAGEESLVASNDLPKCTLFKAGHHGSATSSNSALMSVIQPEIVCVCCCAGSSQHGTGPTTFPTQAFIDRVGIYTDKIYVTTLMNNYSTGDYESMNGNIIVSSDGVTVTVTCSNNNTILKDTDWFKANRIWPSG